MSGMHVMYRHDQSAASSASSLGKRRQTKGGNEQKDERLAEASRTVRIRPEEGYDIALRRARFLRPAERAMLEMALRGHVSRREIGHLLKIPAGTVTRRLQRLLKRLYDPLVASLVDRRESFDGRQKAVKEDFVCGGLPDEHRQVGVEYFLQGQTINQLADLHQVPKAQVQQMLHYVRGWFAGVSGRVSGG